MSQVLDAIKRIRTNKIGDALEKFADIVSKVESNNENVRQEGGGPGRGFYQYEMQAGSKKPQGAKTALNRYKRFLDQNSLTMPESYARELKSKNFDPNDPDFTKLSRELQTEIFYADKQEDPDFKLADLANGTLSYQNAWLDHHWKGPDKDREARIKHYNNEIPQPKPTPPLPEPRPERNMPPLPEPRPPQGSEKDFPPQAINPPPSSFRFDESSTIDSFNSDPSITGGQAEDSLDAQMAEVMGSDPSRYRPVPKEKLTEGESLNSRELLESPTQQEVGPAYTEEELAREAYVDPESARRQQEFEEGTGAFASESTGDQTIGDMLRSFFGTSEEADTYEGPTGEADPANFAEGGPVEKELEVTEDDLPDPPPGATPEEVADDIPAYLSTGEYVLPANVVRYYGLAKIKDLHQNALFELQQMEDLGMIQNVDHNGEEEDDDDEMTFIQEPKTLLVIESSKGLMRPMHFSEGGNPNEPGEGEPASGVASESQGSADQGSDPAETGTAQAEEQAAADIAAADLEKEVTEDVLGLFGTGLTAEDIAKQTTPGRALAAIGAIAGALTGAFTGLEKEGVTVDFPGEDDYSGFGKGTDIGGDDGSRGGGGDDPNISMADLTPGTPRIRTSVRRFIPGVGIIDTAPKRGIMRASNGGMAYIPGVGLLGTGQNTFGEDESDLFSFKDFVLSGTFDNLHSMFIDAPEGYSPDEFRKWEEKTEQRYNKNPILTGKSLNQRRTLAREVTPFGINLDGSAESSKEIAKKDKELYAILSQYGGGDDQGQILDRYYQGYNIIDSSGSPATNAFLKAKLDTLASTRRIKREGISSSDIPEGATNFDVIRSLYAPQVSLSETEGPENTFYPDNLDILSDPGWFKRQYGSDLTGPADVDIVNRFIGASPSVSSPESNNGIMSASPKGSFIPGVGLV
jgi:hypothetical protein